VKDILRNEQIAFTGNAAMSKVRATNRIPKKQKMTFSTPSLKERKTRSCNQQGLSFTFTEESDATSTSRSSISTIDGDSVYLQSIGKDQTPKDKRQRLRSKLRKLEQWSDTKTSKQQILKTKCMMNQSFSHQQVATFKMSRLILRPNAPEITSGNL